MTLRENDVDRMWKKLNFSVNKKAKDVHADLWHNGELVLRTKRSHGSGKLDGLIQHKIRQQMRLDEDQFSRAIECPLKHPEYLEILTGKGLL